MSPKDVSISKEAKKRHALIMEINTNKWKTWAKSICSSSVEISLFVKVYGNIVSACLMRNLRVSPLHIELPIQLAELECSTANRGKQAAAALISTWRRRQKRRSRKEEDCAIIFSDQFVSSSLFSIYLYFNYRLDSLCVSSFLFILLVQRWQYIDRIVDKVGYSGSEECSSEDFI